MKILDRWYIQYGLSALIIILSLLVRWALNPVIGTSTLYIIVFPAIMFIAVMFGAWPGVFGTVIGILGVETFFIEPYGELHFSLAVAIRASILLMTSAYVGEVSRKLRAARVRADAKTTAAQSAEQAVRRSNEMLEEIVEERTAELAKHRNHLEELVKERTKELRESEERRIQEARNANESLASSRLAALNLMEDALEAQKNAENATADLAQTSGGLQEANKQLIEEISERKKVEEALKRSADNLEQFAYVASHDLQEPLRMMASYASLLERRYKGRLDADADEFIGYMVDGAKRLQKLINDLLLFSRVGRTDREVEMLDCNSILEKVIQSMNYTIEENKATVTYDKLPVIKGNESNFIQLFQNLIGNALKFHGQEPPHVHVKAVQKGDEWLFSVRDNGIGIEPQYKHRIFQIFQRLHIRDEYPGTGIGLSICKKIVETYNGRIWVDSELGKGSVFYFTIAEKRREEE
jgi:signal transduction histidine kinase